MIDILLDTNVLIYLFKQDPMVLEFSRMIAGKTPGISVVTYMEMLVGAHSDEEELCIREFLEHFEVVPMNTSIGREVAVLIRRRGHKSLRAPGLADAVIGQTALMLNVPLVTNTPKDFSAFAGLKTIVP